MAFGWSRKRMVCNSRFLYLLSCRTFFMATVSPVSRHLAYKQKRIMPITIIFSSADKTVRSIYQKMQLKPIIYKCTCRLFNRTRQWAIKHPSRMIKTEVLCKLNCLETDLEYYTK